MVYVIIGLLIAIAQVLNKMFYMFPYVDLHRFILTYFQNKYVHFVYDMVRSLISNDSLLHADDLVSSRADRARLFLWGNRACRAHSCWKTTT